MKCTRKGRIVHLNKSTEGSPLMNNTGPRKILVPKPTRVTTSKVCPVYQTDKNYTCYYCGQTPCYYRREKSDAIDKNPQ